MTEDKNKQEREAFEASLAVTVGCPFCGSKNTSIGYEGQPARKIYVACVDCGAQGPSQRYVANAIFDFNERWNKRAILARSTADASNGEGVAVPSDVVLRLQYLMDCCENGFVKVPREWLRDARDALLAAPAAPAPTDGAIEDFLAARITNEGRVPMIATIREALAKWGNAAPAPAAQPVPDGFALVPLRMNAEMEALANQGEWEWADMLAAAEAITPKQYDDIYGNDAPAAPVQAITVWKDGNWKQWRSADAAYAQNDPDWLVTIPLPGTAPAAQADIDRLRKVLDRMSPEALHAAGIFPLADAYCSDDELRKYVDDARQQAATPADAASEADKRDAAEALTRFAFKNQVTLDSEQRERQQGADIAMSNQAQKGESNG